MNLTDNSPKISKHYKTPEGMPRLFLEDGTEIFIEHRHIANWYLRSDYCYSAATKYIFRVAQGGKKSAGMSLTEKKIEDLKKAQEYIGFKIEELQELDRKEKAKFADGLNGTTADDIKPAGKTYGEWMVEKGKKREVDLRPDTVQVQDYKKVDYQNPYRNSEDH